MLTKLFVKNFRNLNTQTIELGPKINCLYGQNGQGKTNILEAVHLLIQKKSFRKKTKFAQMLSMDCDSADYQIAIAYLDKKGETHSYSLKQSADEDHYSHDGKSGKYILPLSTLYLSPFDSYEFHHTASNRRELFDQLFSTLIPEYKKATSRFQKLIKIKNALLSKKPLHYREQIAAFRSDLAQTIFLISTFRDQLGKEMGPIVTMLFKEIFSEEHHYEIRWESHFKGMSAVEIEEQLKLFEEKDNIRSGAVLGSHRDEYLLIFDQFNALDYCSLGQQKMSYLGLLFAYIELFRYKYRDHQPIVLIDDISGELDGERWKKLVTYINKKNFQVLITTANEKFKEELDLVTGTKNIFIKNGSAV